MSRKTVIATIVLVAASLMLQYSPKLVQAEASERWQVPLENPVLLRDFFQPSADWSAGHRGVDYLVSDGLQVFAPAGGEVRFSGPLVNRSVISIVHSNGMISTMEPVCAIYSKGDIVEAGESIGKVCDSDGYSSHCGVKLCLHFGLKTQNGYLSPLYQIGGLYPSRLKPWDGQIRSFV